MAKTPAQAQSEVNGYADSKIQELLNKIPYDKIREKAFQTLMKEGYLEGKPEDLEYIVMEMVDQFKLFHMKAIKSVLWEIAFRQIRKTLSHGVKDWYEKKLADCQQSVSQQEMVAAYTEDLDQFDLGGEGA